MNKREPKPGDLYQHMTGGIGMITDKGNFLYLTSPSEVYISDRGTELHHFLNTEVLKYIGNLIDVGRVGDE
jgi:hypothetical protein